METADRYALTADGFVAKIGTHAEIEKICRWNRVLRSPYEWDMYWVSEDKVVNTDTKYSTPPDSPLVDSLFELLGQTSLDPRYHYELWWCIKLIKEMPGMGYFLIRVSEYSADGIVLEHQHKQNLQKIEDAYRSIDHWIKDFKRGDAKAAIFVGVKAPKAVTGDAMLLTPGLAIAHLQAFASSLPARPSIVREQVALSNNSTLHFYSSEDRFHFDCVRAKAIEKGLLETFEKAIADLCINKYPEKVWYRCALFDHSPMSFGWRPETKDEEHGEWRPMFPGGGGLIFNESLQDWGTHT